MEKLPSSINAHIFRFLSHPVADAIRDRITEFQTFSGQFGSSDLHTFYISSSWKERWTLSRSFSTRCTSNWGSA